MNANNHTAIAVPRKPRRFASVHRYRVLLLVESSRAYGRSCLEGIARYVRAHDRWTCMHVERSLDEDLPKWFPSWRPDGILARVDSVEIARSLLHFKVPMVDLRGRGFLRGTPSVLPDQAAISHLAAEHFRERGFIHFAYCGFPGLEFSDDREQQFVRYLAGHGITPHVFVRKTRASSNRETLRRETMEVQYGARLMDWLRELPKPICVFACNDVRGRQVLSACAELNFQVPEQVAVLGVDNDTLVCDFVAPGLSSIDPDTQRIGYEGAAMLDRMMRSRRMRNNRTRKSVTRTSSILMPPAGVVTRGSTDILAVEDPLVRDALSIIRQHAFTGMNVEGLLDHLMVSRATLERRFTALLHRSPRDEILRIRVQRAQQLLRETALPLHKIAEMCGFKTAAHFAAVFKSAAGTTPGEFRRSRQN